MIESMIGKMYGQLLVLAEVPRIGVTRIYLCKCTCGAATIVIQGNLRTSHTRSCGCLNTKRITDHNLSHTRVYSIWRGMMGRCYNHKRDNYPEYGGKGVEVQEAWHEFMTFYRWAMSNGYAKRLTLDRRDSRLSYSDANCRWVNMHVQSLNKKIFSTNTTGFRSISVEEHRYRVRIFTDNTSISLGRYTTLIEAVYVRNTYYVDNNLTTRIDAMKYEERTLEDLIKEGCEYYDKY